VTCDGPAGQGPDPGAGHGRGHAIVVLLLTARLRKCERRQKRRGGDAGGQKMSVHVDFSTPGKTNSLSDILIYREIPR
jgi:hypothetical protein